MGMAHSIEELRRLSDDELIRQHEEAAKSTLVGTGYYLDEIRRRESDRRERRMEHPMCANVVIATVAASAAVVIATVAASAAVVVLFRA